MEKALAAVGRANVTVLAQHGEAGMRPLAELIQHLTADMHDLSDMLMAHYVSHVMPPLISLF